MITVKNLYKRFGNKTAVDDLNFTVDDGEIFGLIGPNGSGKSTTMEMITGILKPWRGSVNVNGYDSEKRSNQVKQQVGYVPETPVLYESLTPSELFNFLAGLRNVPPDKLKKRVDYYVKAFKLEEYLDQFIGTLSFGTKQKVSIISALNHNPQVLILDEAMNGLDPKTARILREILIEFKKDGKSIIFSTHVLQLAEMICDRIAVLDKGRLRAIGSVDELKARSKEENLEDVFLNLTKSKDEISNIVEALEETE